MPKAVQLIILMILPADQVFHVKVAPFYDAHHNRTYYNFDYIDIVLTHQIYLVILMIEQLIFPCADQYTREGN